MMDLKGRRQIFFGRLPLGHLQQVRHIPLIETNINRALSRMSERLRGQSLIYNDIVGKMNHQQVIEQGGEGRGIISI